MSQRLIDITIREATKSDRLGNDDGNTEAIGPIIISLLPIVIDLIKGCSSDDPERAAKLARSPGLVRKWRLRREVEAAVPGDDKESAAVREHLFEAVLAAGKTATAADFATVG